MIAFCFDLEAHTWRKAVFFTSKTSVNRRSDFLAIQILMVIVVPSDIGLLFVNLSGLETIKDSIIALW